MIVLLGILLIFVLTLVLKPGDHIPSAHIPSTRSTDRDDIRAAHDLQLLR